MWKRIALFTAAAVVAVAPAAVGLAGNSSLSPSVPVAPPTQAVLVDDHGGRRAPGVSDDPSASPSATPTPATTAATVPLPAPSATVDDHGGLVDRDNRVEVGDDRVPNGGASTAPTAPTATPTDDGGHHGSDDGSSRSGSGSSGSGSGSSGSGSGDGSGHDANDDHGGHGSDG